MRFYGRNRYLDGVILWWNRLDQTGKIIVGIVGIILLVGLINAILTADWSLVAAVVIGRIIGLLLGFTIHEWAHAYTAYRLGGWSALPDHSRLSLDPRVHIDPLGVALALFFGFGWARPVPVRPAAFRPRERAGMMTVAFAGPLTNLVIAFVFAIGLRVMEMAGLLVESGAFLRGTSTAIMEGDGFILHFIYQVFSTVIFFNILLFFFNLIPLAPLDGWKVLLGLLPEHRAYALARYERESTFLLFGLILIGFIGISPIFIIIGPFITSTFQLMVGFPYFL